MKSLSEIHTEYQNRILSIKEEAIRQREERKRRERAEAEAAARIYLEVLFAAMTNAEIDRQLNQDVDLTSTRETAATFPIPREASEAFSRCALAAPNFGEWTSIFDTLCASLYPKAGFRLDEIRAAGFEVLVHCPGTPSSWKCEVCVIPQMPKD